MSVTPEADRLTPEATTPAEIAGIPFEHFAPRPNGSVREYDRPFFAEAEGVGRFIDSEAVRVCTHPPGSEVAELLRPIMAERNKPRPATRVDAHRNEEIAQLAECNAHAARERGDHDEAEKQATQARRRKRRAWMIRRHVNAQRRPSTPELRPARTAARARGRRGRRTSSPSRAGPKSSDDGPGEPEPALPNAKFHVLPRVEEDRRRRALEPRCRWRAYVKQFAGVVR